MRDQTDERTIGSSPTCFIHCTMGLKAELR